MAALASGLGRCILGTLLLSKEFREEAIAHLEEEFFWSVSQQCIFRGLKSLWQMQQPIDAMTLASWLVENGLLNEKPEGDRSAGRKDVDWDEFILCGKSATTEKERAYEYMRSLRNSWVLRKYQHLLAEENKSVEEGGNAYWMLADALAKLQDLKEGCEEQESRSATLVEGVQQVYDEIDKRFEKAKMGKTPGIETPFFDLNQLTGGFYPGELVILGARPSVGKSSFAMNCIRHALKDQINVLLVSVEMDLEMCTERLLLDIANIPSTAMRTGQLSGEQSQRLSEAGRYLTNPQMGKLYCLTPSTGSGSFVINDVVEQIRYHTNQYGVQFVIVDYLQLIEASNTKVNRNEQIGEVSRLFQRTARNTKASILALSQLTRIEDKERPTLLNLRDSGTIEQEADMILFMWRSDKLDDKVISVDIAKQRNGPTAVFPLIFTKEYMRFFNPKT